VVGPGGELDCGIRDALDTETCELCRELPLLPEPEPEPVFREREREAPLIHARDVALPLCERLR
jgi:hypothetical protein